MKKKSKYFLMYSILIGIFYLSLIFSLDFSYEDIKTNSEIYSRTATTDTYKNYDGTYTNILYSSAVNRDDKSKRSYPNYVPFEDTLNIYEENGKLIIEDLVEETNYTIGLEYQKKSDLSTSREEFNITKGRGYWYFTSDVGVEVKSMVYKLDYPNKKNKDIKFENEKLKLGGEVTIDFSQARIEQNISTIYDSEMRRLIFEIEEGKTGELNKIDPVVTLSGNDCIKDAYVKSVSPDTNYGSLDEIGTDGNEGTRTYLSWNISSLKNLYIFAITLAQIKLDAEPSGSCSSPSSSQKVLHVYNDWKNSTGNNILSESQITWNNQPCGTAINNDTNCNLTGFFGSGGLTLTVTQFLSKDFSDGRENSSYMFYWNASAQPACSPTYDSKEKTGTLYDPYFEITYTPYIDIISPTPSQILTDDTPKPNFNITNATAFDLCYWTNNSGVNNYSMTNSGNYWYNDTLNILSDGSHTVNFYCNDSSTGDWYTSDSVSFDVDSVNVTVCRDLSVENRDYILLNDIFSSTSDCLIIKNDSVDISGDYDISTQGNYFPIKINYPFSDCNLDLYTLSTNVTSNTNDLSAIYIDSGNDNNISINNITLKGVGGTIMGNNNGMYLKNAGRTIIIINKIYGIGEDMIGIYVSGGLAENNITIYNLTFVENSDIDYGLYYDIDGNIIDSIISTGDGDYDVILSSVTSKTLNVINSSYNISKELVGSPNKLTRRWYFETEVNYTDGTLVNGANVTIENSTDVIYSELTSSNGKITKQELIEYTNNGGTKTYSTPHTITISKEGYTTNSTTYNLSLVNNIFSHIILNIMDLTGNFNNFNWTKTSNLITTSNGTDWINFNNTDTSIQNVSFSNLTNALIYFSNGSVSCKNINFCDGNINISLSSRNYSYVLDNFNLIEGINRTFSPLWISNKISFVSSEYETKKYHLASNLSDSINLTLILSTDCLIQGDTLEFTSNSGQKYTISEYGCTQNDKLILNISDYEYASNSNELLITYNNEPQGAGGSTSSGTTSSSTTQNTSINQTNNISQTNNFPAGSSDVKLVCELDLQKSWLNNSIPFIKINLKVNSCDKTNKLKIFFEIKQEDSMYAIVGIRTYLIILPAILWLITSTLRANGWMNRLIKKEMKKK